MFLVTTADRNFWNTEGKILFLGEWCRIFSQRPEEEKLSYEVMPYHWDDRKKIYQDYLYLNGLYEKMLIQTTELLNNIHGVNHSVRYWRIITGPWLSYFIAILYDRFQSIVSAAESGKVDGVLITRYERGQWVPDDFTVFLKWFADDGYNNHIYSRIIEHLNKFKFEYIDVADGKVLPGRDNGGKQAIAKSLLRNLAGVFGNMLPEKLKETVFLSTSLGIIDVLKLQLTLRQCLYFVTPEVTVPKSEVDDSMRHGLSFELPGGDFEQFLAGFIGEQMPSLYVENYSRMNDKALNAYPKKPKIIFTDNAFFSDEGFKFWAAHHVEKGAGLLGTQHGGLYGAAQWYADEAHETAICDRYYSWGWESDTRKNVKPMPAIKLVKLRRKKAAIRPKKEGRILMVLANFPRYYYHMYSIPYAAPGVLRYFQYQYALCRALPEVIRKLLLIRLFVHDYGWNQRDRWAAECPEVECYDGSEPITDQLKECRLCVVTYNATTVLETFTLNFPTILYWDPEQWEIRPSAQPYYEKLHEAGILRHSPESAAEKITEIYGDPAAWWARKEIQEAKNVFCRQFARSSDNWLKEWKSELLEYKQ
jgi:putative transferase (TIGR04331 family)